MLWQSSRASSVQRCSKRLQCIASDSGREGSKKTHLFPSSTFPLFFFLLFLDPVAFPFFGMVQPYTGNCRRFFTSMCWFRPTKRETTLASPKAKNFYVEAAESNVTRLRKWRRGLLVERGTRPKAYKAWEEWIRGGRGRARGRKYYSNKKKKKQAKFSI